MNYFKQKPQNHFYFCSQFSSNFEFIDIASISADGKREFQILVKPPIPVCDVFMEKTGISNYMLNYAIDLDVSLTLLSNFWNMDEIVLIGYDIVNIGRMLEMEFNKFGISYPKMRFIDIKDISSWLNPSAENDLYSLCELFQVECPINRSLHDCKIIQNLFFELKREGDLHNVFTFLK